MVSEVLKHFLTFLTGCEAQVDDGVGAPDPVSLAASSAALVSATVEPFVASVEVLVATSITNSKWSHNKTRSLHK